MSGVSSTTHRFALRIADGATYMIEADEELMRHNRAAMEYLKAIFEDERTASERAETWELLRQDLDQHRDPDEKLFPCPS